MTGPVLSLVVGCGDYGKELPPLKKMDPKPLARVDEKNSSNSAKVNPFSPGNSTQPENNQTQPPSRPNPQASPPEKRLIKLANAIARDVRDQVVILDLRQTEVVDRDLPGLAAYPDLKFLYLYDTRITDVAVVHLRNLSNLAILDLTATDITAQGLTKLREALPRCNIVH